MFEARHTMDAPATTSADNGTSGGGGGWFTPHTPPEPSADGEQQPADGRRLAALRPVGRPGAGDSDASRHSTLPASSPERLRPEQPIREQPHPQGAGPVWTGRDGRAEGLRDGGYGTTARPGTLADGQSALEGITRGNRPPGSHRSGPPPGTSTAVVARHAIPDGAQPVAVPSPGMPLPLPEEPARRSDPAADPVAVPAPTRPASPDAVLIRRTMAEVGPVADKVTSYFYALLFVRHPDLRPLFPASMDTQRDRLLKALLTAAEHIDNTEVLVAYLQNLGRGHRKYGTRPEHYPAVGECLIGALSRFAEGIWDRETEAAWVRAYTTISQVMIDAAAKDELRAPAWWYAEVVSHDLRTPDVAVITVRPDQPYPFLAGQYTSVETPWWPRIWRHYSFAAAPRSDGLLSFHVKAVPAGWVSNALVHRARPGDIIRLGAPAGSMTVDHTTDSGLLCLGGGTGIAPIKALVEDVAEHGARRPVEVFYGARTDHDLYDIDTMLRLQHSHPWLAVRPVVDRQAHLQLPDAVREYGPWNEYDAYLSGPPGMIRSGVDALRDVGIPSDRIRHDAVEELAAVGN
ncbi:globin domain-containing protein [Streptomyces fructofermentans]